MQRTLGVVVAGLAVAACGPAPTTGIPNVRVDTTWYVSTRARERGLDTRRLSDSLEFGFVITTRPGAGDPLTEGFDATLVDSLQLSPSAFVESVRERLRTSNAPDAAAILYVHGFGTSLHEAWQHAVHAGIRSRSPGPWIVFCWPSNGHGIDWPRRGELFWRAYRDDLVSAAESRAPFTRAAQFVLDAVGSDNLMLLTHSMGVQVAGEALASDSALRRRLAASPLRAAMFYAPDVAGERFSGFIIPAVKPLARRLLLYASTNDRLLAISRSVNKAERAGLIYGSAGTLLSLEGLESVDVTRGAAAENIWQRNLGSHHALRRSSGALFDIAYIVGGRLPATCREVLGTATRRTDGTWRLTSRPTPPVDSLAACRR